MEVIVHFQTIQTWDIEKINFEEKVLAKPSAEFFCSVQLFYVNIEFLFFLQFNIY